MIGSARLLFLCVPWSANFLGFRAKGRKGLNLIPMDRLARTGNGRRIIRDRRPVDSEYGTSIAFRPFTHRLTPAR